MKPMQILIAMLAVGAAPTMESEARAALADAQRLTEEEKLFAGYFTTYAIAAEEGFFAAGDAERTLSFAVNSLSSKLVIKRPVKVSPTLFRVDIRDYGWTRETWALVTSRDPYQQPGRGGALCVRADWFIVEAFDTVRSDAYYQLLYQGKPPRNLQDYLDRWKVRLEDARAIGVETGAVVDAGESMVAKHNRVLARARTVAGAFHQSFDSKNNIGKRDYIENLQGFQFDAQELITSLPNGLHTYLLSNAKGERQEEAPTDIAIDRISDPRSVTVRTARSCIICHSMADGLHPPKNALPELLDSGVVLRTREKKLAEFIERFYLSADGDDFRADQRAYAKSVHKCNGRTPVDNGQAFQRLLLDYEANVSTEQAARELGLSVEEFKQKAAAIVAVTGDKDDANGRLAGLAVGRPCPRDSWESAVYEKTAAITEVQR